MKISDQKGFAHNYLILLALATLVVGGAGYNVYTNQKQKNSEQSIEAVEAKDTLDAADLDTLLPVSEITDKALESSPDKEVMSVELQKENHTFIYRVKLTHGGILFFDAKTGEQIEKTQHSIAGNRDEDENGDEHEDKAVPMDFTATISLNQARTIAQERLPGKSIKKIQLKNKDGAVVYSVKFKGGSRVDVNATSGDIVKVKIPGSANHSGRSHDKDNAADDEDSDKHSGNSGSSGDNSGDDGDHSGGDSDNDG